MTKNKIKTIIIVVACVLVVALAAGLIAQSIAGKNKEVSGTTDTTDTGSRFVVTSDNDGNGAVTLSAELYSAEADAGDTYILTATVLPENAVNKDLDWSVSFVDAASEWAADKSVTDYVTVTPTEDGSLTATVNCLQAFGERIEITATSRADGSKSATCYADYRQYVTDISVTLGDITYYPMRSAFMYVNGRKLSECRITPDLSQYISATCNLNEEKTDVYTIPCDDIPVSFELKPTDSLAAYANSAGLDGGSLTVYKKTFTGSEEGVIDGYFDKAWYLQTAGGTDNATLIAALIDTIYAFESRTAYTLTFYIGDSTEPVSSYNLVFDTSVVTEQTEIEEVSFDETELVFTGV